MINNKSKLAVKLFIVVWCVLALHIALKLTFNYWQPYVIPNDRLQVISDFIDSNSVIKIGLNAIFYVLNGYVMICCSLQVWYLKNKINIITLILLMFASLWVVFIENTILSLFLSVIYPIILNRKKWLTTLLTFIFSNIFLLLSLWIEGFVSANDMNYAIRMFLQFDYYIMLILNYFVFNFITFKTKEIK